MLKITGYTISIRYQIVNKTKYKKIICFWHDLMFFNINKESDHGCERNYKYSRNNK